MKLHLYPVTLTALLLLVACGGGGGSSTLGLTGTTASGAAMAFAEVTLKDASGKTLTVTSDADGKFTITDISSISVPFMLKAVGLVEGKETTLYSVLDEKPNGNEAVANITPMTNAVVTQLAAGDADALFASPSQISSTLSKTNLSVASEALVESVKELAAQLNLDVAFDPFKMKFSANNSGLDKMLDLVKFQPDSTGNITIQNKAGGSPITIAKGAQKVDVVKIPRVESALVNLDVSPLKIIVANLNTALQSKNANTFETAVNTVVDDNFRQDGYVKSRFVRFLVDDLMAASSAEFVNYSLGACNSDGTVCEGSLITKYEGSILAFDAPVKRTGNSWKFFGNQASIDVSVGQVVSMDIHSKTQQPSLSHGIQIDIDAGNGTDGDVNDGKYSSAKVYFGFYKDANNSFDSLTSVPNTTPIFTLVKSSIPNCSYLVSMTNSDGCSNMFEKPSSGNADAIYEEIGQKVADGTLRMKIVANDNPALVRILNPKFVKFDQNLFDNISAKLKSNVNLDEFNKNEISLLSNVEYMNLTFRYKEKDYEVRFANSFDYKQSLKKVGPSIDLKEACERYRDENKNSDLDCNDVKAKGSITYYFQNLRVPNSPNANIWLSVSPPDNTNVF